jgi:organic hydroperoxide reductase OsmC/OhrA
LRPWVELDVSIAIEAARAPHAYADAMTGHEYKLRLLWQSEPGTQDYASYNRSYRLIADGKPELIGSADAAFRGDAGKHNPEELFLGALSACHMLTYLALCARRNLVVTAYRDQASGILLLEPGGGGRFTAITLRPHVTISRMQDNAEAIALHERAHAACFIANSCAAPITVVPTIDAES